HIAETHGLEVEHHPKYGWTITSPGLELLDFVEEQGWQDFQMVESLNLLDVLGTLPKGVNSGAGAETRTKKPSSTRKYICPKCSNSCRATKVINLICGDCMEKMVVAE
ncbi:SprT-like family, partial [human gut metagenome]